MIYVRSRASITLFPRFCLALYLLLHIYMYCQPAGFHLLAILVMFVFYLWIMIFCVRKYELEAFNRGHISIDHPRVLHNTIPWPVLSTALAPDFTLFWPIDSISTSIYGTATDAVTANRETTNEEAVVNREETALAIDSNNNARSRGASAYRALEQDSSHDDARVSRR
jgi:hypothetical protein